MANGMNKVYLLGNLGADPDLRHFEGGSRLRLRLATSESYRDQASGELKERTSWHTLVLWGKRAEALSNILTKGARIMVEGRLETRNYESAGVTRYVTEVKVEELFFAGGRRQGDGEKRAA